MPLYDYKCTNADCGNVFEQITPAAEAFRYVDCPKCRCTGERQLSAPSFRIKGFNARNGYNLPKESDLLNPDGTNKIGLKM